MRDLFGRENYEYYARLTGRILKVEVKSFFFSFTHTIDFSFAGRMDIFHLPVGLFGSQNRH